MSTVGLRDLFAAELTETVTDGVTTETYGIPFRVAKLIDADLSVDVAEGTLYADDSADEVVSEFSKGTLTLGLNDLLDQMDSKLLGKKVDGNGVVFANKDDTPPYHAIGFRAKKPSGSKFRYVWLFKVKFAVPSESYETAKDGINFATPEIEGTFICRNSDGMWKADFTGLETSPTAQNWFTSVVEFAPEDEETP